MISVLLTATVDPRDCVLVQRSNIADRLNDYKISLREWVNAPPIERLILCENSGYPLDELHQIVHASGNGERVTVISYATAGEGTRGKGYGELGIIKKVLDTVSWRPSDRFLKVSGRYLVTNVDRMFKDVRETCSDILSEPVRAPGLVESECFAGTAHFLRTHLCSKTDLADDSKNVTFEHVLAMAVRDAIGDGLRHKRFSEPAQLRGISGGTNTARAAMPATLKAPIIQSDGSLTAFNSDQLKILFRLVRACRLAMEQRMGREALKGGEGTKMLEQLKSARETEDPFQYVLSRDEIELVEGVLRSVTDNCSRAEFERRADLPPGIVDRVFQVARFIRGYSSGSSRLNHCESAKTARESATSTSIATALGVSEAVSVELARTAGKERITNACRLK